MLYTSLTRADGVLSRQACIFVTRGSGECVSEFALVTYTDGVTEERNALGRMFGEQRFESLISENAHLDAAQIKGRYSKRSLPMPAWSRKVMT